LECVYKCKNVVKIVQKEIWQGVMIIPHSKECKGHVPNYPNFKVNEMDYKNGQILSFYGSPTPSAEGIVLDGLRSGNENGNVFGEFDKTDNFLNIY
jgi:hypothetical protein